MSANGAVHKIEDAVQQLLDEFDEARPFGLQVYREATHTEDDWVYVVVVPTRPDIRASQFVEFLSEVEQRVRTKLAKQEILLVPAAQGV